MAQGARRLTRAEAERNLIALDFAIFEVLPDEGTTLGYHPLYKSAKQVRHELNTALPEGAPQLGPTDLHGRLRALNQVRLIVPVSARSLAGRVDGYQRSNRAKALLGEAVRRGTYTPMNAVEQEGGELR
jgi:hypothetical protein